MSTFTPQPLRRTHCGARLPDGSLCGAARTAHDYDTHACPTPYRPETLGEAMRELAAAQASGDQNRRFAARGEVQRLHGARHAEGCEVCSMLEVSP